MLLNEVGRKKSYDASYTQNLSTIHKKLLESHEFKVGDLVKWKEGLKNKKRPYSDQPAIVIQLLEQPLIERQGEEAGSPYYREPLDIILGLFDDDDEFLIFYYDKRRFEPYSESENG
ncbi:hypothetical protein BGP_2956 [Beggiatoa sp. PS]|nr:hypothetical protein BGP_2956 [Beggiatoa sp. PS]